MSKFFESRRSHEQWARFRFSVIGPLLAAPPERGDLQEQLKSLAAKKWHHSISGQRVQFGLSIIERWFYTARNEKKDPVQALRRKIRSDQSGHPALSPKVRELLAAQYRQHPNWSYQLHADNLAVLIEKEPLLGAAPSYSSVVRFMKVKGLIKRQRRGPLNSPGAQASEHRIETREIRTYETQYVNALWHLDFHHGSLRVLVDKGHWVYPLMATGVLRFRSKRPLVCHSEKAHRAEWFRAGCLSGPSPLLFRLRASPSHCRSSEPGVRLASARPGTNRDKALRLLRPDTIGRGSTSGNDHR